MKILLINNKKATLVPLTPADVTELVSKNIEISFVKGVGNYAGYSDDQYISAGAKKIDKLNQENIKQFNVILSWEALKAEKVYKWTNPNQLFMVNRTMVNNTKVLYSMIRNNTTCLSSDCRHEDGVYPYNSPHEQIKGSYAPLLASNYLIRNKAEGEGKCLGSFNYSKQRVTFLILNYSYAGYFAAKNALALGANVTYLENNKEYQHELENDQVLLELAKMHKSNFEVKEASFEELTRECTKADVLIATNMLSAIKTSIRITRDMISKLHRNGVYIDLACESGVSSEMTSKLNKPEPSGCENNAIMLAYDNIPSLFPRTMSEIFGALNVKYLEKISKHENIHNAIAQEKELNPAVVCYRGKIVNKDLADSLNLQHTDFNQITNK